MEKGVRDFFDMKVVLASLDVIRFGLAWKVGNGRRV